jgi:hypothetical protein
VLFGVVKAKRIVDGGAFVHKLDRTSGVGTLNLNNIISNKWSQLIIVRNGE